MERKKGNKKTKLENLLCMEKSWNFVCNSLGLIYEKNVQQKIGRMVVSTQNLEFINIDVNGGYDQISRQVSAHVCEFLS